MHYVVWLCGSDAPHQDTRRHDIPPLHMQMHSTIMSAHTSRYMNGVLRGHHTLSLCVATTNLHTI